MHLCVALASGQHMVSSTPGKWVHMTDKLPPVLPTQCWVWGVGQSHNPGAGIFLSSGMKEPYSPGPAQTLSAGDTTTGISLCSTGEKHEARPRCAVTTEARGNGSPGAKIREEAPNEMDAGAKRGAPWTNAGLEDRLGHSRWHVHRCDNWGAAGNTATSLLSSWILLPAPCGRCTLWKTF